MDKLEPVIRHRFWILLGLCLPLIIYGYMSASGAMQTATEERETTLEGVYNNTPSGQLVNETYAEGLSKINDGLDLEVDLAHYGILEQQQDDMDWPPELAEYVPDGYRAEFTDRNAGFVYMSEYEDLLYDAYLIAEPIEQDSKGAYSGKVFFPYENMPRHEFGDRELNISSERIWNAQEDIWFLRQLLQAVKDVNAGAENIARSRLRRIDKLELMGGNGQPGAATTAVTGFQGGEAELADMYGGDDAYSDFDEYDDMGEADSYGMGGMGGMDANVKIEFDPVDEFGSDVAARTTSTTEGSDGGLGLGMRTGVASTRNTLRYIGFDETQSATEPYRERGFYMSVLIHQQYIPDFLVTLSNSRWPIRIVRFHVGPNPYGGTRSAAGNMGPLAFDDQYGGYGDEQYGGYDDAYSDYEMDQGYQAYGPQQRTTGIGAIAGAFQHPDLVQLDVLGAITLFNPLPEEVLAKVQSTLEGMPATSRVPATPTDDVLPPASESGEPDTASPASEDETSNEPSGDEAAADPDGAETPTT